MDTGVYNLPHISRSLEVVRDADKKNIAMEMSTEASYLLGQIVYVKNLRGKNAIAKFFNALVSHAFPKR